MGNLPVILDLEMADSLIKRRQEMTTGTLKRSHLLLTLRQLNLVQVQKWSFSCGKTTVFELGLV